MIDYNKVYYAKFAYDTFPSASDQALVVGGTLDYEGGAYHEYDVPFIKVSDDYIIFYLNTEFTSHLVFLTSCLDSDGNSITISQPGVVAMRMFQYGDLITDRSEADINIVNHLRNKLYTDYTAQELVQYESNLKGALNTSDLDRVRNYIYTALRVFKNNTTTNIRTYTSPIIEQAFFAGISADLAALYTTILSSTPQLPSRPFNTYQKWNDFEQIIKDIYDIYVTEFQYFGGQTEFPLPESSLAQKVVIKSGQVAKQVDPTAFLTDVEVNGYAGGAQYNTIALMLQDLHDMVTR